MAEAVVNPMDSAPLPEDASLEERYFRAMSEAVQKNNVDMLWGLLDFGISVNVADKNGDTPLHIAVQKQKLEAINFLVEVPGIEIDARGKNGLTPLNTPMSGPHKDTVIKTLLAKGADPTIVDCDNENFLRKAASTGIPLGDVIKNIPDEDKVFAINDTNKAWRTALHMACKTNIVDNVMILLHYGADVRHFDYQWSTCYDLAIRWGNFEVADFLFPYYYDTKGTNFSIKLPTVVNLLMSVHHENVFNGIHHSVNMLPKEEVHLKRDFLFDPAFLTRLVKTYVGLVQIFFGIGEEPLFSEIVHMSREMDATMLVRNTLFALDFDSIVPSIVANSNEYGSVISSVIVSIGSVVSPDDMKAIILQMLSRGFRLSTHDLLRIYLDFDDDFFRTMLHMDIEETCGCNGEPTVTRDLVQQRYVNCDGLLPGILYRVDRSVKHYLMYNRLRPIFAHPIEPNRIAWYVETLAGFFVNETLYELAWAEGLQDKNQSLRRKVPSLLELSRNTCRDYLIEAFCIVKSGQYYTLVQRLPIANIFKDILTFRRTIYPPTLTSLESLFDSTTIS